MSIPIITNEITIIGTGFCMEQYDCNSVILSQISSGSGSPNCSQILYADFNHIVCSVAGYFDQGQIYAQVTVSNLCDCGMPGATTTTAIGNGIAVHSITSSTQTLATNTNLIVITGSYYLSSSYTQSDYQVYLSSGACSILKLNSTALTCAFTAAPLSGALFATVQFLSTNSSRVQVSNMVQVSITPNTTTLLTGINYFSIFGSNFSPSFSVILSQAGSLTPTCSSFQYISSSQINCIGLSGAADGNLQAVVNSYSGNSGAPQTVALINDGENREKKER